MSVTLRDLVDPEQYVDVNWWNWRPTLELVRLANVIDAERIEMMGYNGAGADVSEGEARAIADFFAAKIMPKLRPGERVTYDLSITDVPDDGTFYRDDMTKNYSASYEWLERFVRFCRECRGFSVL